MKGHGNEWTPEDVRKNKISETKENIKRHKIKLLWSDDSVRAELHLRKLDSESVGTEEKSS
jgi:hypothetical protein